ncbi:hypothetical protein CYLTODRAFT_457361 [Cylindrobasidium torrendii FP15055 ss-10]|uniref:Uncharacterized protein n=1 Tax=Cylindrobasidium torrendii FP15055 ss-10 TaxID=1314674 RepID=A0A0D7B293_9AGAR|nr:hypothetical protein CYLTODRAFT_457361 [Cylindrobasidium torrendii FP15055 ss-10]
MTSKFTVAAFLRFAFEKQERYFAAARARNETSAVRDRLPKSFENGPAERIKVTPRVDPFFTRFSRREGLQASYVDVYCYGISLDVDCVSGEKKTLNLELQYWIVGLSQMSGVADASNHELNLRYNGMEATAFIGAHGDLSDNGNTMLSESKKIQKILSSLMEDCGIEVEARPKKKRKMVKHEDEVEDEDEDEHANGSHIDARPDVVDERCMELLTAILGPSGKRVLDADDMKENTDWWTLMKVIQKGHCRATHTGPLTSFLRSTPTEKGQRIDIQKGE